MPLHLTHRCEYLMRNASKTLLDGYLEHFRSLPRSTEHRVVLAHVGQVLVQLIDRPEAVRTARVTDADTRVVVIRVQHTAEVRSQQLAIGFL